LCAIDADALAHISDLALRQDINHGLIMMGLRRLFASALPDLADARVPLGLVLLCDADVLDVLRSSKLGYSSTGPHKMEVHIGQAWHAVKPVHVVRLTRDQLTSACRVTGSRLLVALQDADEGLSTDGSSEESYDEEDGEAGL
jgi:hypothetical protein